MKKRKKRKSREGAREVTAKQLLQVFKNAKKPLSRWEVLGALGLTKKERKAVAAPLKALVREGRLVRTKGGYGLTESMRLVTGTFTTTRSGVGFVLPDDKRRRDVFIAPRSQGGAWHGDRVAVAITREDDGKNPKGRVVRVIERGNRVLPALAATRVGASAMLCRPTDPRLDFSLMVDTSLFGSEVHTGQILLVGPGEQIEKNVWEGELLEVLGAETDVAVQEKLVKTSRRIPMDFPEKVLEQAATFPQAPAREDYDGREDLRELPLVTIDGAKARDFDDAVYVERTDAGFVLWVAIADVAHYVGLNSPLDREARERGNSYYFPQSVEPMLPRELSNGLCSLNPDVDRLAMAVKMEFNHSGKPMMARLCNAVMRSKARLTYAQVNRAILLKEKEERENIADHVPMLERAEALARLLRKRRGLRGSLDFDLPEPDIIFNLYGETVDIRPKVRHFGHMIIEEFMIAANEAVAEYLENRDLPCLYRIHPEPDPQKLGTLFKVLGGTDLAHKIPKKADADGLRDLIRDAEGTPQEFLVNRLMLRSMKQAVYSPNNEGHFGLASGCYCHFTSPIRRYADLVVHRVVKHALGHPSMPLPGKKDLARLGGHLSDQERTAMEAEREILKRLTVLLLRNRVGERFTGVISSLMDYGFWVELDQVMAEGLVRISEIGDDFYTYFEDRQLLVGENTGRAFRLGMPVEVELADANLSRLEIDLALVRGGRDYKEFVD